MIFFAFITLFHGSNTWNSYIYTFILTFPKYSTNQFNDQAPVGLIAQMIIALINKTFTSW